ncbi:MAG: transcription termination/antitermination protein NusG [Clostridia bacterium]|nr:transcription termination/antitermination protein NusG [Clostridia bacterium]
MSEEAKWYVVHTYSGYENKVASNLEKTIANHNMKNMIQEVKIPTEIVTEIKDGKERQTERKIFPGYVLVKMILNNESWYIVRNIRGCTGFVGSSTKPIPLSPEEVKKLGVEVKSVKLSYKIGESVKIIDGPLANLIGKVESIDTENKTVKVTVSMFGRETPAELDLGQIEPAV